MIMTMKVMVVLMTNYVHDHDCGIEDCLFIRWLYEDNGGGAGMMVITMISISYYHSSYCMAILVPRSWRASFWLQQLAYQQALGQKEMYSTIESLWALEVTCAWVPDHQTDLWLYCMSTHTESCGKELRVRQLLLVGGGGGGGYSTGIWVGVFGRLNKTLTLSSRCKTG